MIKVEVFGALSAKNRLKLLSMQPGKRARLLSKLARFVRKKSRERITKQTDIHGQKFEPRKNKGRRKMLTGLKKKMKTTSNSQRAKLFFTGKSGSIAAKHQYGHSETVTASKARRKQKSMGSMPATRTQAKRLKELGYTTTINGKKKTPTIKAIVSSMTIKKAGAIIRTLEKETPKSSWEIELPPRAFFGATEKELNSMTNILFGELAK